MAWTYIIFGTVLPIWLASVAVYNIYFHPLANVPGPALAAITSLYKTYYNATNGCKFYLQIQRLHQEFGTLTPLL